VELIVARSFAALRMTDAALSHGAVEAVAAPSGAEAPPLLVALSHGAELVSARRSFAVLRMTEVTER
jgi:hypothetical protein